MTDTKTDEKEKEKEKEEEGTIDVSLMPSLDRLTRLMVVKLDLELLKRRVRYELNRDVEALVGSWPPEPTDPVRPRLDQREPAAIEQCASVIYHTPPIAHLLTCMREDDYLESASSVQMQLSYGATVDSLVAPAIVKYALMYASKRVTKRQRLNDIRE